MYTPKIVADARGSRLITIRQGEIAPMDFLGLATTPGVAREVVRFGGGCKGFTPELVSRLHPMHIEALTGFCGVAFSGGTANADADGNLKDDMVTNIPARLAEAFPCIAIHTTPRTAVLAQDYKTGRVVADGYGGRLDNRAHANMVVEKDPYSVVGWDGDLVTYLDMMKTWQDAGFRTMIEVINGGDVTRDEIYGGLARGIPVLVLKGSLREADAFIAAVDKGDWTLTAKEMRDKLVSKNADTKPVDEIIAKCQAILSVADTKLISVENYGDAAGLRSSYVKRGFLQPAEQPVT